MADENPPLLKPIPRRPFDFKFTSATPPEDEDSSDGLQPGDDSRGPSNDGASISRPPSFMNLTSSTLYGIYSPTASSRDRVFSEGDTPWGTGAQTPIRRPSVDDATYELMRERSHLHRRRSSYRSIDTTARHSAPAVSTTAMVISLTTRVGLLFTLGVGYGVLLDRFQDSGQWPATASFAEGIIKPGYNYLNLAFWGFSGVILGGALPWFDKLWADSVGNEEGKDDATPVAVDMDMGSTESSGATTDWALVMRAVGAFVGIVFAIRKVAWASTLQVSVGLALVNPFLWWLIDRSIVGLLLSATVSLLGSIFLFGVNPNMMPAPPASLLLRSAANANSTVDDAFPSALAGLASQGAVESGVWMLSVLFCSCLCFGNIGRRLNWDKSAVGRGRWGGVR